MRKRKIPKLYIGDIRFLSIELDLVTLEYMIEALKHQIPGVITREKEYIAQRKGEIDKSKPIDRLIELAAEQDLLDFEEETIPRFFYCPFLSSLYSICEAALIDIAKKLKEYSGVELDIDDISGDFTEKIKKYYKSLLHFDIFTDDATWRRLIVVKDLRHVIVHANGRLDMMRQSHREKIRKYKSDIEGIDVFYQNLIISERFLSESVKIMKDGIIDLIKRVKETHPAK